MKKGLVLFSIIVTCFASAQTPLEFELVHTGEWSEPYLLERIVRQEQSHDTLEITFSFIDNCDLIPEMFVYENSLNVQIEMLNVSKYYNACTFVYEATIRLPNRNQQVDLIYFNGKKLCTETPKTFLYPLSFELIPAEMNRKNEEGKRIGFWSDTVVCNGQIYYEMLHYEKYLGELREVWKEVKNFKNETISISVLRNDCEWAEIEVKRYEFIYKLYY